MYKKRAHDTSYALCAVQAVDFLTMLRYVLTLLRCVIVAPFARSASATAAGALPQGVLVHFCERENVCV